MSRALVCIDLQAGFDDPRWGTRNNPEMEAVVADLLSKWRAAGRPVVHVHHRSTEADSPLRPDVPGAEVKPEAAPIEGEPVFEKSVNSALIGTELEAWLHGENIEEVVLCGLTTDHCVSTTARMAENLGFDVAVVRDATATFERELDGEVIPAEENHRAALAQLSGEFARIETAADVLRGR